MVSPLCVCVVLCPEGSWLSTLKCVWCCMSAHDDKAHRCIHIHPTVHCSSQPFSLLSFLPSFSRLSFTSHKPPFSFSSSFSSSSWQAFVPLCCSDTFLGHGTEREKGRREDGRDEKEKGGKKLGMLAMLLRVIFYFIVVGEREEWVSKERVRGSNRKWQRWKGWEQPDNGGHICKERLSHLSHVSSALVCPFLGNFIWLIFISSSPDDSLPSFSLYSAASLHFFERQLY